MKREENAFHSLFNSNSKMTKLELIYYIGNYTFSAVPKSLFSPNNESLLSEDKTSLLHVVSAVVQTEATDHGGCHRILIIDGMVVDNQITKTAGFEAW